MPSYILGFSGITGAHSVAEGHNPAAVLLRDGKLVAGAAEERFNRIKNSPGLFPKALDRVGSRRRGHRSRQRGGDRLGERP